MINPTETLRPVLVTGGLGYIGGCLTRQLLEQYHSVRVFDSALYGAAPAPDPRIDLIVADIRNSEALKSSLEGVDAVVHLAAIVGDPACALDPTEARAVNLTATETLLDACESTGVSHFVFASTCSVYGAGSGEILTEDSPLNPVSVYAKSKGEAEQSVLAASSPGLSTTVLRFATIFGLAPRLRFDLVANLLTARASRGLPLTIHGGGQWRPFLHVRDVAGAIVRVIHTDPKQASGLFNVGSNTGNHRLAELGQIIAEIIPGSSIAIDPTTTDQRTYRVSFDKFERTFGAIDAVSLKSGIAELHEFLIAHPEVDISNPAFDNARYLANVASNSPVTSLDR